MTLNISTGELKISDVLTVKGGYTFEQFRKTPFYSGQDGIRTITLDGFYQFGGSEKIKVTLFFRDSIIYMVSLSCFDTEYSFENEPERKKLHDSLLKKCGIAPFQAFSWGAVTSAYDPKGSVSSIDIQYL